MEATEVIAQGILLNSQTIKKIGFIKSPSLKPSM